MRFLKLLSVFLTMVAVTLGILQLTRNNNNAQLQQNIDIHLAQPGPAPAPQFDYLQVQPGMPDYFVLPMGWPIEYYRCPQFYFYYEPCITYYRPGISIFLGAGWWYTPGVGCINIGFFGPHHPFSACREPHRVVHSTVNISNHQTTINITKINNTHVTPTQHPQPHQPPHVNPPQKQPEHKQPPHKEPEHKTPPQKQPEHKTPAPVQPVQPHQPPHNPPNVQPPHNPTPPNPPHDDHKKKK